MPTFSQKHYEALAAALAEDIETSLAFFETTSAAAVARFGESLADVFAADNERFDRERFLRAAHVERAFEGS